VLVVVVVLFSVTLELESTEVLPRLYSREVSAYLLEVDSDEVDEVSATEVMVVVPLVDVRLMLLSELKELPEIRLLSAEVMVMFPSAVKLLAMLDASDGAKAPAKRIAF